MPPRLIVSKPLEEAANISQRKDTGSRRRDIGSKNQGRSTSSEWIDINDSPPRRGKCSKRSSQRRDNVSQSSDISRRGHHTVEGELSRFFPSLSRISEVAESTTSSRTSARSSHQRRHRDRSSARRSGHSDDSVSVYRRPVKHRTGGVTRRSEGGLKVNPSLLSVLSSLTGNSDRSSGSSSTITQQSFDRREIHTSRAHSRSRRSSRSKRTVSEVGLSMSSRPNGPNVFDYMEAPSVDDDHDGHSVVSSSSSSHYEPSDGGSSQAPDTPSSRSTFPSPTTTRSQSVADLRNKYDVQYAASTGSTRSNSNSPDPSLRSLRKQPSVSDVPEDDEEEGSIAPTAPSVLNYDPQQRSSSRSSRGSARSNERMRRQEQSVHQHMAYTHQEHYVEPVYGQHRSFSNSSAHSDRSAYAYQMAMRQYQWPLPPAAPMAPPAPPQTMNGHIAPQERPQAPEAPDLSQRTLTGYEELALELSTSESPIKPLYRKFEYLNHRILLHLQDELCELEEQLRTVDEIIAQMDSAVADGQKTPVSRRGEAFHGSEIHFRRTQLLGQVFVKTEQYNRAMSAYASMAEDSTAAEDGQVEAYQQWMAKHSPIHDVETRFLKRSQDLIVPGKSSTSLDRPTKHAALAYIPVALMLPLLLYSIIPTLAGRLVVTALIAVGAFIVAATTRIRLVMPAREWAVCGAAYVLLMAAIAGCIPSHA